MPSYGEIVRELREALQKIKGIAQGPEPRDPNEALGNIERIATDALIIPGIRTPK
jgi:hypothetical protein